MEFYDPFSKITQINKIKGYELEYRSYEKWR